MCCIARGVPWGPGCSVCWDSVWGMGKVEGAKCSPVSATLLFGAGPWGGTVPLLPPTRALSSAAAFAAPALCSRCLSWCHLHHCHPGSVPWAAQALQHAADTQQLGELSPRAGLAGRYKPDIRFMLLALRVTAGFTRSPKLLAAAGVLLARVEWANCMLILECLHFVFVMAG